MLQRRKEEWILRKTVGSGPDVHVTHEGWVPRVAFVLSSYVSVAMSA